MNGSFEEAHSRLWNRLRRTGCLMALFVHAGKLRFMQVTNKEADKLLDTKGVRIVGFYDAKCAEQWLLDDLIWADKHCAA